jgi:hypothetical protein
MLRSSSASLSKKPYIPAIGGGLVFWATTVAISLLPIAAEYRAAFAERSWSAQTVWVDSLFVGMLVGGVVSYSLLRFFDRLPSKNPILKSVMLGFIALVIAILLIDVPQSYLLLAPGEATHYFLIGTMLNAPRFLFLGIVIGYLYKRLYGAA